MALLHQIKSSWDVSRILWSWKIWSSIIWRSWVLDISLILSWFPQYLKCPKAKQSPQSFTVHWALTKPVVVIWWYSVSSLKHWLRYTYNLTSTLNSCSYDITVSCPCPAQGSVVVAWHRRSWSCLSPKPPRAEMFERKHELLCKEHMGVMRPDISTHWRCSETSKYPKVMICEANLLSFSFLIKHLWSSNAAFHILR